MPDNGELSRASYLALARLDAQDDDERMELEAACIQWLDRLEEAKKPRAVQHFENTSYLLGNHLTRYFFSDGGFGTHTFGLDDHSEFDSIIAKCADNRLVRPTESVAAALTRVRPQPRVAPQSSTPEDEDAATIAEILIPLVWDNPLDMQAVLYDAAIIAATCGTVAAETQYGMSWLPRETPRMVERTEKDVLGEKVTSLVESGETDVTYADEMQVKLWTEFHISVNPGATSPRDLVWIARTTFEDVDWVREHFGHAEGRTAANGFFPEGTEHILEAGATDRPLYWWSRIQDILDSPQNFRYGGGLSSSYQDANGLAPGQCAFTVIDVRPSKEFPKGRTLVLAGNKLIYAGPARAWSEAYPWRWHNYSFFGWFRIPGRFWHTSLLSLLVPLQKKINAIDAIVHANREFVGVGQWLIPKHAKVAEGTTGGLPGLTISYNDIPGYHQPEKVKNDALPADLFKERGDLIAAIDIIAASGTVGANEAVSPSAARSGPVLNYLRSERLESKTPMVQAFERFLESIAQNTLIELQLGLQRNDQELTARLKQAASEHSSLMIKSFIGADLRGHHRVKIDIATELLRTPEADQSNALEAAQAFGAAATPPERSAIFEALGLDKFVRNAQNLTVNRARRMVSRIVSGALESVIPLIGIDDPVAAAEVFRTEMLSDRFNDLEPGKKRAIEMGFDAYAQLAAEEARRAMEQQIAMAQAMQSSQKRSRKVERDDKGNISGITEG